MAIAHKKIVDGKVIYEPLENHLRWTAHFASKFALIFKASRYLFDTGMNHDAGKWQSRFKNYIIKGGKRGSVKHSRTGSYATLNEKDNDLIPMAMAIHGHHEYIPDFSEFYHDALWKQDAKKEYRNACKNGYSFFRKSGFKIKRWLRNTTSAKIGRAFFIRMVYSCLVDADWLATEKWMRPDTHISRYNYDSLDTLLRRHKKHMRKIRRKAKKTYVNKVRSMIHRTCCHVAKAAQGVFSLEVPTGGGKTLAGMSFALRHAIKNGQKRVIVVLPYTSIIEQTTKVYRDIFGNKNVIEHHTVRDPEMFDESHELAIENWDAPVIITTSVQFFETLFGHYRGRLRKLHNIANSVVILDEVQTLNKKILEPSIAAMKILTEKFNTSFVISTATQPAFGKRPGFDFGFEKIHPIIKIPGHIFNALRRVEIKYIGSQLTWKSLADKVKKHKQALIIVNTKRDARKLAKSINKNVFFLSGYISPKHRSETIQKVKSHLKKDLPCILVSTQVVEAGVDIDFPVVYRVEAPYDSIVQSAGRCNREGRLKKGIMYVIRVKGAGNIPGYYTNATSIFKTLLKKHKKYLDIYDTKTYHEYFSMLYNICDTDQSGIIDLEEKLIFSEVNKNFKVIEPGMHTVIIPTDEKAFNAIEDILNDGFNNDSMRVLQRYSINVWEKVKDELLSCGYLTPLFSDPENKKSTFFIQQDIISTIYNKETGLMIDNMSTLPIII